VPLAPRPVLAVALALAALLGALLVGSPVASAQTRYRTLLPTTARESNTAVWTVGPTAAGLAEGVALRSASSVVRTADFGRPASRVSSAGELFFAVDDAFIYRGSYGDAFVDVSYYDKGFGFFYLVYDATASRNQQSFGPTTNY
jgi:hypothetical protein